ncbi:hypothetical protein ES332_A06G237100v1 [Gossypium tomentosum]|uniref:H(+)-exporting diphosphatase n=1 Tax=Gossypium tomentosum TaxID=34277 RepID=A0A5D2Q8Q4_GOSTO|nr:hypothetical protein ES332_A06G237100v1 [Gossypium tomentosum]
MSYRFFFRKTFSEKHNFNLSFHFLLISSPSINVSLSSSSVCLFFLGYQQDYKEEPDYGRYVAIVASASLREMIKPGALAIISPIVVGL